MSEKYKMDGIVANIVNREDGSFFGEFDKDSDAQEAVSKLNQFHRMVEALRGVCELQKMKAELDDKYPAGTCNSEDAWGDFADEWSMRWEKAKQALSDAKEK